MSTSETVAATYPGATASFGKTAKPGKSTPAPSGQPLPAGDLPVITEVMTSNSGSIAAADGKYYDWIEFYNPTGRTINLQGFTLSDNLKKPTKSVLPSYALAPGAFAIVYCDGNDSTKDELHASFKLKASGQMLVMVDANGGQTTLSIPALQTNTAYALDMGNMKTWSVTGDYTPGFPNTKEGRAAYLETRRAASQIVINEVMAGNTLTFKDADGDYSDWVEIYNGSDKEADLTGWGLSNRESEPKRWELPAVKLGPKQYLLVFLSGKNRTDPAKELHADFRLNAFKDTILLANARGQIVSQVAISNMKADSSGGLDPASGQWKAFSHPTPGQPNTEDGYNALQPKLFGEVNSDIVISEVMTNNASELKDQDGAYPDWIELHNRGSGDVSLSGWGLTNKSNELGRWKFPDITLKAGQYYTVFASGKNIADPKKKLHTDFNIPSSGGMLVLTKPDGSVADRCLVPQLRTGVTYGRQAGNSTYEYFDGATPGEANAHGYPGFAPDPAFSLKAGQYQSEQKLEIETGDADAVVYYTTDSTAPKTSSKKYAGTIDITKTTAIRAISYRNGYLPSNEATSTYLLGDDAKITLPIVSIVTSPSNLWDEETGIYSNIKLDESRPAYFEILDNDGRVGVSQMVDIKISGAQSKIDNKQKSFGIYARGKYGKGSIDGIDNYQIFPDLPFTSYETLMVRNSGQDARLSRIRDTLQIGLAHETTPDLDMQAHRQSILFVNGEFFGVYDIMEKVNEQFLAQHHNLDPKKINLLRGNAAVITGSNKEYNELLDYVKSHDLSIKENYDYVASRIDIDNYIDWCTIEIYTGNSDLGNIKFWKPQTADSKWKWILFDMDWGFYFADQSATYRDEYYRDNISRFLDPRGNGVGRRFSTALIRGLLKNEEFRQKFIKRFYYHATVTFETNRVLQRIDELQANIAPYMARDKATVKEKFGQSVGTVDSWNRQVELLRTFARMRPEMNIHYMREYFKNNFGMSDAELDALKGN